MKQKTKNRINNAIVLVAVILGLSVLFLDLFHLVMDRQYSTFYHVGQSIINLTVISMFTWGAINTYKSEK